MGNGKIGGAARGGDGSDEYGDSSLVFQIWGAYGSYFASAHTSFSTNALKIIEIENPF